MQHPNATSSFFLYYLASTLELISEIAPTIQQMVQELLELLYICSFKDQSMQMYIHPGISIVAPHEASHQEQAKTFQ